MINYHKKIKYSEDAREAYSNLESVWSGESALNTVINILILEKLEILTKTRKKKPKRKQSEYSVRLGRIMKEKNISIKDAHVLLKEKSD